MRRILICMLLVIPFFAQSQSIRADKLIVKKEIKLKSVEIDSISTDGGGVAYSDRNLWTQKAIIDYINENAASSTVSVETFFPISGNFVTVAGILPPDIQQITVKRNGVVCRISTTSFGLASIDQFTGVITFNTDFLLNERIEISY